LPGALRALRQACELAPEQSEYHMYRCWAEHCTTREEQARALTRSQATAAAQRMLESDAQCVRAHAILGDLARETGDTGAAERWFRLALRIDPDDREAQRGMRLLSRRKE
jgi:cytochrome c-type biogenesis protein CcmH/NrfG